MFQEVIDKTPFDLLFKDQRFFNSFNTSIETLKQDKLQNNNPRLITAQEVLEKKKVLLETQREAPLKGEGLCLPRDLYHDPEEFPDL